MEPHLSFTKDDLSASDRIDSRSARFESLLSRAVSIVDVRRYSHLGYISPIEFESRSTSAALAASSRCPRQRGKINRACYRATPNARISWCRHEVYVDADGGSARPTRAIIGFRVVLGRRDWCGGPIFRWRIADGRACRAATEDAVTKGRRKVYGTSRDAPPSPARSPSHASSATRSSARRNGATSSRPPVAPPPPSRCAAAFATAAMSGCGH
jgi:hypothetical protein